jgi:hypothetical protein
LCCFDDTGDGGLLVVGADDDEHAFKVSDARLVASGRMRLVGFPARSGVTKGRSMSTATSSPQAPASPRVPLGELRRSLCDRFPLERLSRLDDPAQVALGLARACGLSVVSHDVTLLPHGVFAWDGSSVNWAAQSPQAVSNLIHEVAHFLVADPARRPLVNFGQGSSPDELFRDAPRSVPLSSVVHEEQLASSLGLAFEWVCGLDWAESVTVHGWQPQVARRCAVHDVAVSDDDADVFPPFECVDCWIHLHASLGHAVDRL